MAYYNGQFNGWENYKPSYISGNTLWLDGSDANTISKFYATDTTITGWRSKHITTYSLFKDADVSTNWWTAVTRMSATSNVLFQNRIVTMVQATDNLDHFLWFTNALPTGRPWVKFYMEFYIPSTNTNVDGIQVRLGNGGPIPLTMTASTDQWYSFEIEHPDTNELRDILITPIKGVGAVFVASTGSTDDIFYIREATCWTSDSVYFEQTTTAARPIYVPSANTITFDGIQEFLDGSSYIANFTGDTEGELISVFKRNSTSSQTYTYSIGDNSNNNNQILFDHAATSAGTLPNDIRIYSSDGGSVNAVGYDSSDTDNKVISWSSSGSIWKIFRNNLELTPLNIVGSNIGIWFSDLDVAADTVRIGRWAGSTVAYGDVNVSEIIYYNRQLTNKERKAIFKYLNTKYSIY